MDKNRVSLRVWSYFDNNIRCSSGIYFNSRSQQLSIEGTIYHFLRCRAVLLCIRRQWNAIRLCVVSIAMHSRGPFTLSGRWLHTLNTHLFLLLKFITEICMRASVLAWRESERTACVCVSLRATLCISGTNLDLLYRRFFFFFFCHRTWLFSSLHFCAAVHFCQCVSMCTASYERCVITYPSAMDVCKFHLVRRRRFLPFFVSARPKCHILENWKRNAFEIGRTCDFQLWFVVVRSKFGFLICCSHREKSRPNTNLNKKEKKTNIK